MAQDADIEVFIKWFQSNGGFLDAQAMGITEFPNSGRGAIALCDIPVCYLCSAKASDRIADRVRIVDYERRDIPFLHSHEH